MGIQSSINSAIGSVQQGVAINKILGQKLDSEISEGLGKIETLGRESIANATGKQEELFKKQKDLSEGIEQTTLDLDTDKAELDALEKRKTLVNENGRPFVNVETEFKKADRRVSIAKREKDIEKMKKALEEADYQFRALTLQKEHTRQMLEAMHTEATSISGRKERKEYLKNLNSAIEDIKKTKEDR